VLVIVLGMLLGAILGIGLVIFRYIMFLNINSGEKMAHSKTSVMVDAPVLSGPSDRLDERR
jgi:hypothetical protein